MYATISALKNEMHCVLVFRSYFDAWRFKRFVLAYLEEVESNSSYRKYWISKKKKIELHFKRPKLAIDLIDQMIVGEMLCRLVHARTLKMPSIDYPNGKIKISLSKKQAFSFWIKLPKTTRPAVGDFCKVLLFKASFEEMLAREGLVVGKKGRRLKIVSKRDLDFYGKPNPSAKIFLVRAKNTMKIKRI